VPVERKLISLSQLCELVGVDPDRLIDVDVHRPSKTAQLILEPAHEQKGEEKERHA
jgi:hypothetical protein